MQETFSAPAETITRRTSLRYMKGVGPERYKLLCRLGLFTLQDLIYFFPRRYENRKPIKNIEELSLDDKECVKGVVQSRSLIRTRYGQSIFKLVLANGKTPLFASWFNMPYMARVFTPKATVVLYGKAEREGKHIQMIHPEYEIIGPGRDEALIHSGRITPIYALTEDLSQKAVRQMMFGMTRHLRQILKEYLPPDLLGRQELQDIVGAVEQIHFPDSYDSLNRAYKRLAFDEFFMMQTVIQMKRLRLQAVNKESAHLGRESEVKKLIDNVGFELTAGQKKAIQEIIADMKKVTPMNRLVQGDVGSGKTIVAAAGLLFTVSSGFQGALMAPTEVLAQQHFINLSQALEPLGLTVGLLVQSLDDAEKKKTLERIKSGDIHVAVGTHALIQSGVQFKKLGLAVIDEQHKFGVFQRGLLREKGGAAAHFLLMTATPIPRTLAMTLYGDLDITTVNELPKGRKPVKTIWVNESRRDAIYALVGGELEKGRQAFVICPLIDKNTAPDKISNKKTEIKSVLEAHAELTRAFSTRKIGLLHGQMKADEKKRVMQDFKDKKIDVLVSTVVIEVGVDVPNATLMIIENAERFGLSQLHQLRGRVGRGAEESICVLFSDTQNPETSERLAAFEKISSGFEIAEKDLELRGSGEVVGDKQHGLPELRIGDLIKDMPLAEAARREARALTEKDPKLELPKNKALKRAIKERFKVIDEELTAFTG